MEKLFLFLTLLAIIVASCAATSYVLRDTVDKMAAAAIEEYQRPDLLDDLEQYDVQPQNGGRTVAIVLFVVIIFSVVLAVLLFMNQSAPFMKEARMLLKQKKKRPPPSVPPTLPTLPVLRPPPSLPPPPRFPTRE